MQVRLVEQRFKLLFERRRSLTSALAFSAELQKPCAGQPTVAEVLEVVLKECRKESLVYKMAALRCAGDVLHSSKEDRFSDAAEILFPLIKKVHHTRSYDKYDDV